ncbi:hypothetical protein RhiJN_00372 [Ceratobasidium sp. AG-Ba]|nr:hypothetical protein RhiJN_00372 [Ceratobasidium sp. AG-Ba]QRW01398.1 hypothetical protein RhiLY_00395 [Ceratobasidium sp. AG-Ba]
MPMSSNSAKGQRSMFIRIVYRVGWLLGCVITLGYASKYYFRVKAWQVYDPTVKDKTHRAYTIDIRSRDLGLKTSIRAKQQKEWDRLIMPLSVITATSAAALAIPSPFGEPIYWVATALFSGAFGLSLEGLIIITYLTVFGAGSSAETIGRIASGKGFLKGFVGPVAIVTALPTAITTYSSVFLLAGLLAMTIAAGNGSTVQQHMTAFKVVVLVPVCLMLLCLVFTIGGCEFFAWKEGNAKLNRELEVEKGLGADELPVTMPEPMLGPSLPSVPHVYTAEPAMGAPAAEPRRGVTFRYGDPA